MFEVLLRGQFENCQKESNGLLCYLRVEMIEQIADINYILCRFVVI